jgi:hypothetical protein
MAQLGGHDAALPSSLSPAVGAIYSVPWHAALRHEALARRPSSSD